MNGFVAPSASPEDLAAAIERVHDAGPALRERDRGLVRARTRERLSLEASLERVLRAATPTAQRAP